MRLPAAPALCAALILGAAAAGFAQEEVEPVMKPSVIPGLMYGWMDFKTVDGAQVFGAESIGLTIQLLQASTPSTPAPNAKTPEPYKKEEFPQWLQDLWRVGVIFFGSLPFTYFYTLEAYDMYRYVVSGFDFQQAPWPFRPGSEIAYSPTEQLWLITTSVGLSVIVAATDFLIDQLTRPNER